MHFYTKIRKNEIKLKVLLGENAFIIPHHYDSFITKSSRV